MGTATEFDSSRDLKDSWIVIATFSSLWLGMALLLFLTQSYARLQKHWAALGEKEKLKVAVSPAQEEKEDNKTSPEKVRESIRAYVISAFPHVFSDEARSKRLLHELFQHHDYLAIFAEDEPFKAWMNFVMLLTNIPVNMCVLAIFYDLQWYKPCSLFKSSSFSDVDIILSPLLNDLLIF